MESNTNTFPSIQNKQKESTTFFRNARIMSCTKVVAKNGSAYAIPFNTKRPSSAYKAESARQPERISTSQATYRIFENLHAGQVKKPLERYDPNSKRSRLPIVDFVPPYKNSSQIILGDRINGAPKHFQTTYMNEIGTPPNMHYMTTHPGILSSRNRWIKHQQSK